MKERQRVEFQKLMTHKKEDRPSDLSFSPIDEEKFIEQLTTQQLEDYISMHRKTFENSKKHWKNRSIKGLKSITVWLWNLTANKQCI